jgi:hypothetical protein
MCTMVYLLASPGDSMASHLLYLFIGNAHHYPLPLCQEQNLSSVIQMALVGSKSWSDSQAERPSAPPSSFSSSFTSSSAPMHIALSCAKMHHNITTYA